MIRFTIALLFLSTLSFAEGSASHAAKQPAPGGRFSAPATGFSFVIPTTGLNIPDKVELLDATIWEPGSCKIDGDFIECTYKNKFTGEEKVVRKPKPTVRNNSSEVKAPSTPPAAAPAAKYREISSQENLDNSFAADAKAGTKIIMMTFGFSDGHCPPCNALKKNKESLKDALPGVAFYHVDVKDLSNIVGSYRTAKHINGGGAPETVMLQRQEDGTFAVLDPAQYGMATARLAGSPSEKTRSFVGSRDAAALQATLSKMLEATP